MRPAQRDACIPFCYFFCWGVEGGKVWALLRCGGDACAHFLACCAGATGGCVRSGLWAAWAREVALTSALCSVL